MMMMLTLALTASRTLARVLFLLSLLTVCFLHHCSHWSILLCRSKNLEGEMLSPTRASLLPHTHRANYVTMWDKSYQKNCPELPPIEENGWNLEDGGYVPVRCLALPAPRAVLELIKCGCKAGCKGRCSCSNHTFQMTMMNSSSKVK